MTRYILIISLLFVSPVYAGIDFTGKSSFNNNQKAILTVLQRELDDLLEEQKKLEERYYDDKDLLKAELESVQKDIDTALEAIRIVKEGKIGATFYAGSEPVE